MTESQGEGSAAEPTQQQHTPAPRQVTEEGKKSASASFITSSIQKHKRKDADADADPQHSAAFATKRQKQPLAPTGQTQSQHPTEPLRTLHHGSSLEAAEETVFSPDFQQQQHGATSHTHHHNNDLHQQQLQPSLQAQDEQQAPLSTSCDGAAASGTQRATSEQGRQNSAHLEPEGVEPDSDGSFLPGHVSTSDAVSTQQQQDNILCDENQQHEACNAEGKALPAPVSSAQPTRSPQLSALSSGATQSGLGLFSSLPISCNVTHSHPHTQAQQSLSHPQHLGTTTAAAITTAAAAPHTLHHREVLAQVTYPAVSPTSLPPTVALNMNGTGGLQQQHRDPLTISSTVHAAAAVDSTAEEDASSGEGEEDEDEEEEEEEFDPLLFMKLLPPLADCVPRHRSPLLPRQTRTCARKTLVLDLDETLVHSSLDLTDRCDFSFPVLFNATEHMVHVRRRPHLDTFMNRVAELFEVVIFTASQKVYAERLLNIIDPTHNLVKHRIYRDSCVIVEGNYLKDLSALGRDLTQTLIVDNSPQAFGFQVDNGVPIESWYEDQDDDELLKMLPFLESLVHVEDVRPHIRDKFKLNELIALAGPKRSLNEAQQQ